MSTEEDRERLGRYIVARRRSRFGSVENAIRAAGVNRQTWANAEAGSRVRDDRLTAIEAALGWNPGDAWRVMAGQEPTAEMSSSPQAETRPDLRRQIEEDPDLAPWAKRAILALLDAERPPEAERGVRDHDRPAAM